MCSCINPDERANARTDVTTTDMTPDQVAAILTARPREARCSPRCRGWAIFHVDREPGIEIEACDECNQYAAHLGFARLDDADAARLPAARRALARELVPASPHMNARQLKRERAWALREHDLRSALELVASSAGHAYWQTRGDADARAGLVKVLDIARHVLDATDGPV